MFKKLLRINGQSNFVVTRTWLPAGKPHIITLHQVYLNQTCFELTNLRVKNSCCSQGVMEGDNLAVLEPNFGKIPDRLKKIMGELFSEIIGVQGDLRCYIQPYASMLWHLISVHDLAGMGISHSIPFNPGNFFISMFKMTSHHNQAFEKFWNLAIHGKEQAEIGQGTNAQKRNLIGILPNSFRHKWNRVPIREACFMRPFF